MRRGFYKYPEPRREDYGTEEEYNEAVSLWEDAEDAAAEEYIERKRYGRERE